MRKIHLVELENERQIFQIPSVLPEVLFHVLEAFYVRKLFVDLRIRYKNNSISSTENEFSRCVITHLTGHGVKLNANREILDSSQMKCAARPRT